MNINFKIKFFLFFIILLLTKNIFSMLLSPRPVDVCSPTPKAFSTLVSGHDLYELDDETDDDEFQEILSAIIEKITKNDRSDAIVTELNRYLKNLRKQVGNTKVVIINNILLQLPKLKRFEILENEIEDNNKYLSEILEKSKNYSEYIKEANKILNKFKLTLIAKSKENTLLYYEEILLIETIKRLKYNIEYFTLKSNLYAEVERLLEILAEPKSKNNDENYNKTLKQIIERAEKRLKDTTDMKEVYLINDFITLLEKPSEASLKLFIR